MIAEVTRLKPQNREEDALARACIRLGKEVRDKEENCLLFRIFRAEENRDEIILIKLFSEKKDLEHHWETEHYMKTRNIFEEVLEKPAEVQVGKELM